MTNRLRNDDQRAQPSDTSWEPSTQVGPYRILASIGEGGMGTVYKAHDTRLDRIVALKVSKSQYGKRFKREARVLAALNHPNICTIYDIGSNYLVMEYIEGQPLKGPAAAEVVLPYALQILDALSAAHEKGITHRDLKPANILLTRSGIKLLDFGMANVKVWSGGNRTATQTQDGAILGTPCYMSPEQAQGKPVDARADIFAFGALLYELLSGRRAFRGPTVVATLMSVLRDEPAPLEGSPEMQAVITRCLSKHPADRYQSVCELRSALREAAKLGVADGDRTVSSADRTGLPSPSSAAPPSHRLPWKRWQSIPIAAAVLAALVAGVWRERERLAGEDALRRFESLADAGEMMEAYRLAQSLQTQARDDHSGARIWDAVGASERDIVTDPPGADISVRDYLKPQSEWIHLGRSPLHRVRLPFLFMSLRARKNGYADVEWAVYPFMPPVKLTPLDSTPSGMVYVLGTGKLDQLFPLDDFWLDRYEVTNAEYKKFVDAGGYRDSRFWKQPFVNGAQQLTWEEAIARFRDATGRPGPASWEMGSYPEGTGNLPVTGVSWFEAAAYAEYAGKQLPTVYHWQQAALYMPISSDVIALSNFSGKGPAQPGTYRGASFFGSYDMAGNVKEWCWNADRHMRYILGGAWSEPSYMFAQTDARSPFERGETFGFRCVRYAHQVAEEVKQPLTRKVRDYSQEKPVAELQYRAFRNLYSYDRTALEPKIEAVDDTNPNWRKEKITITAAYGNERVIVYLYLPKGTSAPYQTIIHFPAVFALAQDEIDSFSLYWVNYFVQSGRALVYPVYKGSYERRSKRPLRGPLAWRDQTFQWCKDLGRSIDYLETRADIDRSKLVYHGMSMGSSTALPCLAIEERFKAAILLEGGLSADDGPPESDPFHFAPHIRVPTLMINGRDDFIYPVDQLQSPLFRLLGASPENKRHVVVDGGHAVPRNLLVKESLNWLDRHLGPVAPH
ncbi:MAG: protein kinase [Bryobacteraceae bacterium]